MILLENIKNDIKNYINNCALCLRIKGGISFKPIPKKIIPKGPLERIVVDEWKINNDLSKI